MTATPPTWHWHSRSFRAMNTHVYLQLYSPTEAAVLEDVERLFTSFEKRLSRFKPTSELSQLNNCNEAAFTASPTLLEAVETALWAAQMTGGLYDPATLTDLEQAGYDRSFEQMAHPAPLNLATEKTL